MKGISAQCGHVKRRLNRNERLDGNILDFAINLIGETEDDLLNRIAEKLKAGDKLSEHELHIMVDVHLSHARLGA